MPIRRRIGQEIAPLARPQMVRTRKFHSETPVHFGLSEVFRDDGLTLSPTLVPDDGHWTFSTAVTPDFIEPLTHYIAPRHFAVVEQGLHPDLSSNLLAHPDQGLIGEDLIAKDLNQAYPVESREGAEVSLDLPVSITDPPSPEGQLVLEPPSIETLPFATLPFVRVMGMNYRDRMWQDVTPEYERTQIAADPKRKRSGSRSKADTDTGQPLSPAKHKAQPNTFWEDVFLLLQPPIVLTDTGAIGLPHDLLRFQPRGIRFLMENEGALLADEMGTGKTVMTTVALRILFQQGKIRRALILCPVSVLREWDRHLREWAPELHVTFIRGLRDDRKWLWKIPTHVYVTTYSTFRNDLNRGVVPKPGVKLFDAAILDEAQYIKSPKSGRARAVKRLKASYRWALSGTPVENKLEDLASIFDFLHPKLLSSDALEPEVVKEKIAPFFLRRRKIDVLPDLPPKQHQDFWLELDPAQRRAYDEVEAQIRDDFATRAGGVTRVHIFRAITRLKQICNFAPNKATSSKVRLLKEQIEEIIATNQKVLVFTQFIGEGLGRLQKALSAYGVAIIKGGQGDGERFAQVERFKKAPASEVPILLASVRAAGVGLNLKEATYVIHFDHWWNPAVMWQAEDRAHRADQTHGVNVYSYWIENTIEERIYEVLEKKHLLFQSVVGELSDEQFADRITDAEWLHIVLGGQDVEPTKARRASVSRDSRVQQMSLDEIRNALHKLTPAAFEDLTGELFRRLGYPNVRVTGRTADGGIDVIAQKGTRQGSERVAVQCKRYEGKVGIGVARELRGVMASDTSISDGFLVTSGAFTPKCIRFCDSENIKMISGIQMAAYVKRYNLALDGH